MVQSKETLPLVFVQHLRAKNDENGNPRRVFVVSAPDRPGTGLGVRFTHVKAAWNEGHEGAEIVRELVATGKLDVVQLPTVDVTPKEYAETLKRLGLYERAKITSAKAAAAYVAEHAPDWGV